MSEDYENCDDPFVVSYPGNPIFCRVLHIAKDDEEGELIFFQQSRRTLWLFVWGSQSKTILRKFKVPEGLNVLDPWSFDYDIVTSTAIFACKSKDFGDFHTFNTENDHEVRLQPLNEEESTRLTYYQYLPQHLIYAKSIDGIIVATHDGIDIWEMKTRTLLKKFGFSVVGDVHASIWTVAYDPIRQIVMAGDEFGTIILCDFHTCSVLRRISVDPDVIRKRTLPDIHNFGIYGLKCDLQNGTVISSTGKNGVLNNWSLTGECLKWFVHPERSSDRGYTGDMRLAKNNRLLFTSQGRSLLVWSYVTGKLLKTFKLSKALNRVFFRNVELLVSYDGKRIFIRSYFSLKDAFSKSGMADHYLFDYHTLKVIEEYW